MPAVPIYVSNQQALVWTADDVATLRTTGRVCGALTGTLPSVSQQNVFLGLPLMLMPEEVVLLVEKQLAVLVDETASHGKPSKEQLQHWNEHRKEQIAGQQSAREEKETKPKDIVLKDDALAKRQAREAKKAQKRAVAGMSPAENGDIFEPIETPTEKAEAPGSKDAPYWVHVPSTSVSEPWYNPITYTSIEEARKAGIWTYPSTDRERARCVVFRNLWEQGYFMGSGLKFGGDFLVYPGDPLRYHSHFVATAFPSPVALLRPMDIIAFGRLGTATKKAHLLCGWDEDKGEVTYFSIEWANFG